MKRTPVEQTVWIVLVLVFLAGLGYGAILYYRAYIGLSETQGALNNTYAKLAEHAEALKGALSASEYEKTQLSEELAGEKAKNSVFESQIQGISGTVGLLDKLAKTDPELLKKYSKVFFLSEHYVPGTLSILNTSHTLNPDVPIQIHTKALPYLTELLSEAQKNNLEPLVASGYRSFGTQSTLKSIYRVTYGAGTANAFSADQGYSEHQLGTTVDFTSVSIGNTLDGFENSPEYAWLRENAHRFGFILSYPENNSYYEFEPWHWRFVGVRLATDLHRDAKHFYDLDQRSIDAYLVYLFD